MSRNYVFILDLAAAVAAPGARLLDFGCGAGALLRGALQRGFDAWGVDTYAGGFADLAGAAPSERVRLLAAGAPLPFETASFDVVVSNQVFEHVAEPDRAVAELARVLRPGGRLIALFPTREVLVEPHLKTPLAHWLPNGSAAQRRALALCHMVGLCHAPGLPRAAFISNAQRVLQEEVFLRPLVAATALFATGFTLERRAEPALLRDRLGATPRLAWLAPVVAPAWLDPLLRGLTLRLAGTALVLRRD